MMLNVTPHTAAMNAPVLTQDAALALGKKILSLTSSEDVSLTLRHATQSVLRVSNNHIRTAQTGSDITLSIVTQFGARPEFKISTNQLDDASLQRAVQSLEAIARQQIGADVSIAKVTVPLPAQRYLPVDLWHDVTAALSNQQYENIPLLIERCRRANMLGAIFAGVMARTTLVMTKSGVQAVGRETDGEFCMTVWNADGKGSAWAGSASRDWSQIDANEVTERAITLAKMMANPVVLEPGRRTTIFAPAAVAQLVRLMGYAFDAQQTDAGQTPLSDDDKGNKLGMRVVDGRITMSSDPADPQGGYLPFDAVGLPEPKMTWISNGVLQQLAYSAQYAANKGKSPAAAPPSSIRMSGGTTSLETMIGQCQEGIYVNRLSNVRLLDQKTGLMTGVTRDGCFYIKNGRIEKAIKNFRFLDSPFYFFNRVEAIGPSGRQALGYTPSKDQPWPLAPIIVPPVMVYDFNFSGLADAV